MPNIDIYVNYWHHEIMIMLLFFKLAFALTDKEKNEGCRVACIRSNYDGGQAYGKGCICIIKQDDYFLFVHNRTDISDMELIKRADSEQKHTYYDY